MFRDPAERGVERLGGASRTAREDDPDAFTERLVAAAEAVPDRTPADREAVVAPLVDDSAVERYREVCGTARAVGTVLAGGEVVDAVDGTPGRYVRPPASTCRARSYSST